MEKSKNTIQPKAPASADCPNGKRAEQIEPTQLAMLAALLAPNACKTGEARSVLFHAIALWEESVTLCDELGPLNIEDRLNLLAPLSANGDLGARHLHGVLFRKYYDRPEPTLTLAARDEDGDTLRPYLVEQANFEGQKGERKAWSQIRTVLDNFKKFFLAWANRENQQNVHNLRGEMERLGEVPSWESGGKLYCTNVKRWERFKDGKLTHYEIPESAANRLIRWRRDIRPTGGLKSVRSLTLEEVIAEAPRKVAEKEAAELKLEPRAKTASNNKIPNKGA